MAALLLHDVVLGGVADGDTRSDRSPLCPPSGGPSADQAGKSDSARRAVAAVARRGPGRRGADAGSERGDEARWRRGSR